MPLVAATSTQRPCSTARSRPIASCCHVSSESPKVALLVWTTSTPATLGDRLAHQPVVGHLEADDVADRQPVDVDHTDLVPGAEVAGDAVDLAADQPGHRPERDVLGERHGVLLDVAVGLPHAGTPEQPGVEHVVGPVAQHRTDQQRAVHGLGRRVDQRSGAGVGGRVDVARVLRPHDEVRGGLPAGVDVDGELQGLLDVVAQHGLALGGEVEPEPGDRALDDGEGRVRSVRAGGRQQRGSGGQDGGDEQGDGPRRRGADGERRGEQQRPDQGDDGADQRRPRPAGRRRATARRSRRRTAAPTGSRRRARGRAQPRPPPTRRRSTAASRAAGRRAPDPPRAAAPTRPG